MLKRTLSVVLCAILMLGLLPVFNPAARMAATSVSIIRNHGTSLKIGDTLSWTIDIDPVSGTHNYAVRYDIYLGASVVKHQEYSSSRTATWTTQAAGDYKVKATVIDYEDGDLAEANKINGESFVSTVALRPKPTNVAVANVDGKSVKVSWKAVAGVTGYKVLYSKTGVDPYSAAGYTTGTSYTKGYLTPGVKYYFKVVGYNLVGSTKVVSTEVSASKMIVPIGKATIATITSPSANRIKLTWAKVTGAARYLVQRAATSGGTYVSVYDTTYLSYTNTGLTSGKTYYYRVKPYRIIGATRYYGVTSAYRSAKAK